MLKLKEWEKVQDYASKLVQNLCFRHNLNVKSKIYTMYDNTKGISLQLFDKYNSFYTEYFSGIHNDLEGYKNSLDKCYNTLLSDI